MSLAKIYTVAKCQKDQGECEKCHTPLPKGSAYRWFKVGFRSRYKHKRCMKTECSPRESERESSLVAGIYAAQEGFKPDDAGSVDELKDMLNDVAEQVREVASAYSEAADAMGEAGEEQRERAEHYESQADDVENTDLSAYEDDECETCNATGLVDGKTPEEPAPCPECDGTGKNPDALDLARQTAQEGVDAIEML